jgi:cytoskeleton protein RodZ
MSSQEPDNRDLPQHPDEPQDAQAKGAGHAASSPGAQLIAERRAQGLSLGDVARRLKLSVRQVEALERDEYAAFPGPVFVRGFLRNYAKLLQLEPEALVAQAAIAQAPATAPLPATASVPATPVPLREPRAHRRSRFGFGTLALAAVLVILAIAAVYDARNKPAPVSLAPPSVPGVAQAPGAQHADSSPPASPGAGALPAPTPAASEAKNDAVGATDAGAAGESAAAGAAPTGAVGAANAPGAAPVQLPGNAADVRLTFDDESWVEIKDATGAVIFSRLNSPGSEQAVSGKPPLELVIGNAQSVRLIYRGEPIDLAPHTRVDVARVRLE